MDDKTISIRQQFAEALGLQKYPWLIRLTPTAEGGWKIRIKGNAATYRPSKHDTKIQETVEIIGGEGWFFKADAENGVRECHRPSLRSSIRRRSSGRKAICATPTSA